MEIDEVIHRVVSRYFLLLVAAVLLPVGAAALLISAQAMYQSTARIQLSATTPASVAESAALISQAQAVVTSDQVVRKALQAAHATRNVTDTEKNVTVTGLGGSAVAQLDVADHDPRVARAVATSLSQQLVTFVNSSRMGGLPRVLAGIDEQLTMLAERRAPLAAAAQASPRDLVAQNRLSGIDRLITDLSSDRNRLAVEAAAGSGATMVNSATTPDGPQPSGRTQLLALVGLAGFVVGLLLAAGMELLRPTVSGGPRIARMLSAAVLGRLPSATAPIEPTVARGVRLAAQRAGTDVIVIADTGHPKLTAAVSAGLQRAILVDTEGEPHAGRGAGAAAAVPAPPEPTRVLQTAGAPQPRADSAGAARVMLPGRAQPTPEAALRNGHASERFAVTQVRPLDQLPVSDEQGRVGVVVVSPTVTSRAGVEQLRDLLVVSGWPLLGVVTVHRSRLWWRR